MSARKLLAKAVADGRLTQDRADAIIGSITPSLTYQGFDDADMVVEAVVENLAVKQAVLREIEGLVSPNAILASNTSSLRIGALAEGLRRPENFLGMHFFNPVPKMPLVEVVRGAKTSVQAIAAVTGYAAAMGKTPIVVEDCPGFVVNRALTPYLIAFLRLVHDGAGFQEIDKAMEAFGWPMGPAYLIDVIGMDIAHHVIEIVSAGFAPRMDVPSDGARNSLARRAPWPKNGHGFYKYESDSGRPRRNRPDTERLLARERQRQDRHRRGGDCRPHDAAVDPRGGACVEDGIAVRRGGWTCASFSASACPHSAARSNMRITSAQKRRGSR
jgi:3-hydroxyacyl-CoA dehydrogenase/enoyl-CoA hydratase/3-hydroxybutyryl-CoA epimerase/enoyl-CoA isomerase